MALIGRVHVVGLGPAGAELMLPAARTLFGRVEHRYVRTARHPAVEELARFGVEFTSFDSLYESAADLDAVYRTIVEQLTAAAQEHHEIVYAVPGNPNVAERTVVALRDVEGLDLHVVPGLSFAELAWSRLGVDPLDGVTRVVDAHRFAISAAGAQGRLLIAQCDHPLVVSDVKLALLDVVAADHPVTVLQRLGLRDERVETIALEDLDRVMEPDHLTSVYVDTGDAQVAPELAALWALTQRLRGPGGCPWDAEQTHHSLARHTLEEAYEVIEAIERLPVDAPNGDFDLAEYDSLEDELGDLLFQVMIHSALASETGAFTVADVAARVHEKLVRRHPHVFGETRVDSADDVVTNWEQIKKTERDSTSLIDGMPKALPALLYVPKLFRRLKPVGLDPSTAEPLAAAQDAAARLADAPAAEREHALGAALAALVALARAQDVDAEAALRGWAVRLEDDYRELERRLDPETASADDVQAAWRAIRDAR